MSPLRSLSRGNWLALCAVVLASALVGLVFFLVIDRAQARQDGVTQAKAQARQSIDTRQAASRRIDLLAGDVRALSAENGQLASSVAALAEQVRQMGGRPVAALPRRAPSPETPRTGPASTPRASASQSPPAASTPRPVPTARPSRPAGPSPRPSPSPPCRLPLPGPCLLR